MHNTFSLHRIGTTLLVSAFVFLSSCTDPNSIGGPNNINGVGTSGSGLLSQKDRVVNGFQLEHPQYDGITGGVTFDGQVPKIDMHIYRRTQFKTSTALTDFVASVTADTVFDVQKAYINISERTLELQNVTPSPRLKNKYFAVQQPLIRDGVQQNTLSSGKLSTNFYLDPLKLEETIIELQPAVQITSPTVGAVIDRKNGITVKWNTPLMYDSKTMFAEAVIVGNVKDSYPTNNALTDFSSLRSAIKRIPSGSTSMTFSSAEMVGLPADFAAIAVNLYSVKPFRNNTMTLRATTHSFVQVELR